MEQQEKGEYLEYVNIPPEVKDKEAYFAYLEFQKRLNRDSDRYFQTSDPGLVIDLFCTAALIRKQVKHLPVKEIEYILELAKKYREEYLGELSGLKMKAFGKEELTSAEAADENLEGISTQLIEMFRKHYSHEEVWKYVVIELGMRSITKGDVERFYRKNIDTITQLKEEYRTSYTGVRLTHKRSRLEELSWLYETLKEKYYSTESVQIARECRTILKDIKAEVEGDLVVNGKVQIEIEVTLKEKIEQEFFKDFNVTQVLIARIAGKRGIDSTFLLSRLANSYYAKFAGFLRADNDRNTDEIIYPSSEIYDFSVLEKKHGEFQQKEKVGEALEGRNVGNLSWAEKLLASLTNLETDVKQRIMESE